MKMPTEAEIRLAAGELTAGEMRTVKAVLQWFINTRCSEAVERDAARYRWLRDKAEKIDDFNWRLWVCYGPGEDFDDALDQAAIRIAHNAAMRQSAGEGK